MGIYDDDELEKARSLLVNLVKAFKREADRYLIKTRWQKEYREAKAYLKMERIK